MMTLPIHVLCATDNNYVPYCGVMITSVFENNKADDICIHIFGTRLSKSDKESLCKIGERYNQQVEIYDMSEDLTEFIPPTTALNPNTYITLSAYNRIFAAELLPQNIKKILYLDCDIIVTTSLRPCWEEKIEDYALGVVGDTIAMEHCPRLCLDPEKHLYFNSGVLLINLDYWRMHNIQKKCMDYIIQNQGKAGLLLHDQDTLNVVTKDCCLPIHPKYNVMPGFFRVDSLKRGFIPELYLHVIHEAIQRPVIIHYTLEKPWYKDCDYPLKSEWIRYLALTEWKDMNIGYKHSLKKRVMIRCKGFVKMLLSIFPYFKKRYPRKKYIHVPRHYLQ
jgi:lipopolysaccharide biosynthesis glycosyltransferase